MLNLTKQQAVEEHRKMWNWIADETLRRKKKVWKEDYFGEMYPDNLPVPINYCFCCDYVNYIGRSCISCPTIWDYENNPCTVYDSLYTSWRFVISYEEAAEFARLIAERPEREDTEFDIV